MPALSDIFWLLIRLSALVLLVWWGYQAFGPGRAPGRLAPRLRRAAGGVATAAIGIILVQQAREIASLPARELVLVVGVAGAVFGLWLGFQALLERPGPRALALWFRSLGLALEAATPLDDALQYLARDPALERLQPFTRDARAALARGFDLAVALRQAGQRHGLTFGALVERLLARGEASGEVAESCFAAAAYLAARGDEPLPAPDAGKEAPRRDEGSGAQDAEQYAIRLVRELITAGAERATLVARPGEAVVTYEVGPETRTFGSSADPALGRLPLGAALGERVTRVLLWRARLPYWRREAQSGQLSVDANGRTLRVALRRIPEAEGERLELQLPVAAPPPAPFLAPAAVAEAPPAAGHAPSDASPASLPEPERPSQPDAGEEPRAG